jgi:guanylate kinase
MQGKLVYITGCRGAGKSTLADGLLEEFQGKLQMVPVYTTRAPRARVERDRIHVSEDEFSRLVSEGKIKCWRNQLGRTIAQASASL